MTVLPASIFDLKERGRIAPGFAADLVLFNPKTIRDRATFSEPHRICEGIETVWVNGDIAWSGGCQTPARSGRFLKRMTDDIRSPLYGRQNY
jgi:N-acyl-D-aspartate/D-glutamate deacylase